MTAVFARIAAVFALTVALAAPARAQFFPFFGGQPPRPRAPVLHHKFRHKPKHAHDRPKPAAKPAAKAEPEKPAPAPAAEGPPPPYEPQLLRLSEIMGALAVLQPLCASAQSSSAGGASSFGAGGAPSVSAGGAPSFGAGGASSVSAGGASSFGAGGASSFGAGGASSFGAGGAWRDSMQQLMDSQDPGPRQRERLAGAYNRGLRGYEYFHHQCTPTADLARRRLLDEGERLAHEITALYRAE